MPKTLDLHIQKKIPVLAKQQNKSVENFNFNVNMRIIVTAAKNDLIDARKIVIQNANIMSSLLHFE